MKQYQLDKVVWDYLTATRETGTAELISHCVAKGYTKQGVHRVLRRFESQGRILRLHGYVAVNLMWVQDEIEKLASLTSDPRLFFETFDTKRTYKVHTLEELDQLWGQLFVLLLSSQKEPLSYSLFYDLHNYTYIHKVPVVEWYIKELYKKMPKICLLVGSQSPLDVALRKKVKHIAMHLGEKKWPCFIAVIGEFVISNYVDTHVWERVDVVFDTMSPEDARDELLFLSRIKGSYKIVVEKNKEKSDAIAKYFRKYFVLPT